MTDQQKLMLHDLRYCKLGREQARYIRDIEGRRADELTPRQDWYLRRIHYMYRDQIGLAIPKPDDFDSPPPLPDPSPVAPKPSPDQRRRNADAAKLAAWNAGEPKR